MNTIVISAFPGVGKTYVYEHQNELGLTILDSDSSNFSWIKDENGNNTNVRNPEFPSNYVKHIISNVGNADIIFVSSHKNVRDALLDNGVSFVVVYPNIKFKNMYLDRYKERGNSKEFISNIEKNWNMWIREIEMDDRLFKKRLDVPYLMDLYCPSH